MKHIRIGKALPLIAAFLVAEPLSASRARPAEASPAEASLAQGVRSAILESPRYGPFDLIRIEVKGHTVTLGGVVDRPTLKAEAGEAARAVPGVARVVNSVEILPLSFEDDRLRRAVFRRIYRDDMLSRYGTPVTWRSLRTSTGALRTGSSRSGTTRSTSSSREATSRSTAWSTATRTGSRPRSTRGASSGSSPSRTGSS